MSEPITGRVLPPYRHADWTLCSGDETCRSPHYPTVQTVDHLAAAMHVAYEAEAVRAGWETQERSRLDYSDV